MMQNLLRVDWIGDEEKAAMVHVSQDGRPAFMDGDRDLISFPGGCKKFTVRRDPVNGRYWSLVNHTPPNQMGRT